MDHYVITDKTIRQPPASFGQKVALLGPGFILSASIVGSGELIATTTLGARAGFTAFWIIIISCLMKVAVQLEFGKHTILTGETAMHIFNKLPGPRFGKGNWAVWSVLMLIVLKVVQIGGILGGAGIVLHMLFPSVSIVPWVLTTAIIASALIFKGYYQVIEKLSLVMIAMFTVMTLTSIFALSFTPYSISWSDIASGFGFKLSGEMAGIAIGAFGITGVASDEIIAYNYWCLEKGYAAYTGPCHDDEAWRKRARGWINVMYLDATVAMIIYTLVTGAFYLLGAAVLHGRGVIPEGNQVIDTVAYIYTESLGEGVRTIYLVGAFFVLFSSVFATLAMWTRLYPDIFGQLGWINFFDLSVRKKLVAILSWIFPVVWTVIYLFIKLPVIMILFGGIVGSVLLFIVIAAAVYIRYTRTGFDQPTVAHNVAFWISVVSISAVGVYGLVSVLH